MTCLFLAAKVEEQPRRIRDAINCVYYVRRRGDAVREKDQGQKEEEEDQDMDMEKQEEQGILPMDRGYWDLKETVVDTEQLVLRVLGFDLDTYQPYRILLNYARSLRARPVLVEVAWALLNDSLFSPTCCHVRPPQAQAVAALHLAQRLLLDQRGGGGGGGGGREKEEEIKVDREMWAVLGAEAQDVEGCCHELLTLYEEGVLQPPVGRRGEEEEEERGKNEEKRKAKHHASKGKSKP